MRTGVSTRSGINNFSVRGDLGGDAGVVFEQRDVGGESFAVAAFGEAGEQERRHLISLDSLLVGSFQRFGKELFDLGGWHFGKDGTGTATMTALLISSSFLAAAIAATSPGVSTRWSIFKPLLRE